MQRLKPSNQHLGGFLKRQWSYWSVCGNERPATEGQRPNLACRDALLHSQLRDSCQTTDSNTSVSLRWAMLAYLSTSSRPASFISSAL